MHSPSTLVAALTLAFASGAAAASATASGKTLNIDGIWPKTNSAQLEFVYAFPSATAEAQALAGGSAIANAADRYMSSVYKEPGYSAYESAIDAVLASQVTQTTNDAAASRFYSTFVAGKSFFTALPTSAQAFYKSVDAQETAVIKSAASAASASLVFTTINAAGPRATAGVVGVVGVAVAAAVGGLVV